MPRRRTVLVVTGSRAEFGLLAPVMTAIAQHRDLTLKTVVTGTHLTTSTWRDVTQAGFTIDARLPMQRRGQIGRLTDVAALGRGISGFTKIFQRIQPEVVLVLGDRIEAFAAAGATNVGGFHLAHIHGGDRGTGVADEAMRHAISKLAHLHFAATAASRKRLIRMGESSQQVFNVGSPAADLLQSVVPAPDAPQIILVQHPIGAPDAQEEKWMRQTLAATSRHRRRLILAPNADPGSDGIRSALQATGAPFVEHIPRPSFLSLLTGCAAIVGNSSAGLIEAAVLKKPCVNIGPRQNGREKPSNVIDCPYGLRPIRAALDQALSLNLSRLRHPYGDGHTGQRIAHILATVDLDRLPLGKQNTY